MTKVIASCAVLCLFAAPTFASSIHRKQNEGFCTNYMCISATGNGSTLEYTLSNARSSDPGWMAMGFGRQMTGSPMVIMWTNDDGSITLSQRQATGHIEPKVVSNPPAVATLSDSGSSVSSGDIRFAYTMEADGETTKDIIYAYGSTNPGSSAIDATLQQHISMGTTQLTISGDVGSSSSSGSDSGSSGSNGGEPLSTPLQYHERLLIAHGIFSVIGFLFLLPAGALLARYLRTFSSAWYTGHWITQFGLAGPVIIVGGALGFASVSEIGASHFKDDHQRWGLAIFILYFVQCSLGAIIHWFKPKGFPPRRPPQNYGHAILGIAIIAFALYQVRTGFREEWPKVTGRGEVANGANIIWYVWVVLLPVLYFAGLAFLPKQYRQEAQAWKGASN